MNILRQYTNKETIPWNTLKNILEHNYEQAIKTYVGWT